MPVSFSRKLLFIHIPKNAGTSVVKAFNMQEEGHITIEQHKLLFPQEWKEFHKFCIVRNPWERVVSCYEYARMEKSYHHSVSGPSRHGKHPDYDLLKDKSFEECVDLLDTNTLTHQGWAPQSDWVVRDNIFVLNEYIKSENLGKYYKGVKIPHLNKSTRKIDESYYTPQAKQKVTDFYKEDMERFDYEF